MSPNQRELQNIQQIVERGGKKDIKDNNEKKKTGRDLLNEKDKNGSKFSNCITGKTKIGPFMEKMVTCKQMTAQWRTY
jgi:hypothetical protein